MNYLTTIALLFGSFLSFSQGSFIHLQSNHLSKKTTEYFGSLDDKTKSDKVEDAHFINFNPTITFNGVDDYLKVNEEIPDLTQMTVFTVFMPSEITEETFDIWNIQSENSSLSMTNVLAENSSSQLSYSGIENGKPSIHTYTQYFRVGANEYTNGDTYIMWCKNEHQGVFDQIIITVKKKNELIFKQKLGVLSSVLLGSLKTVPVLLKEGEEIFVDFHIENPIIANEIDGFASKPVIILPDNSTVTKSIGIYTTSPINEFLVQATGVGDNLLIMLMMEEQMNRLMKPN